MNDETIITTYPMKMLLAYVAPTVEVVEVKCQGLVCQSLTNPSDYPKGDDPFPFFEDFQMPFKF